LVSVESQKYVNAAVAAHLGIVRGRCPLEAADNKALALWCMRTSEEHRCEEALGGFSGELDVDLS
jgi:hypothetical protein